MSVSTAQVVQSKPGPRVAFEAITLTHGVRMYQVWEALKDLVEEVNVVFTKNGIMIASFDVEEIALINLTLWAKSFQRYVYTQTHICGLNTMQLYKAFKMCTKQSAVTLRIMSNDPSTVLLQIQNVTAGCTIEIKLLSVKLDKKMLKISNSVFTQYMTMPSNEFHTLINFIGAFSSTTDDENAKELLIEAYDDSTMAFSSRGESGSLRMVVRPTLTGMKINHGNVNAIESDEILSKRAGTDDIEELEKAEKAAAQRAKAKRKRNSEENEASDGEEAGTAKKANQREELALSNIAAAAASSSTTTLVAAQPPKLIASVPFILAYVRKFTRASSLSPEVKLFVKEGFPAIFTYAIGNLGILHFCLGPTRAKESGSDAAANDAEQDNEDGTEDDEEEENKEEDEE